MCVCVCVCVCVRVCARTRVCVCKRERDCVVSVLPNVLTPEVFRKLKLPVDEE